MNAETSGLPAMALPAHLDCAELERKWHGRWQAAGIYDYDPSKPREATYAVDTPPPTVSGSLHIGHVFSYTHTDVIVRQKRMAGFNTFYPMGWDDNGLPTERRVQNYFHVRCDPTLAYVPDLTFAQATDAERKQPPRVISRQNFIDLCLKLTHQDEEEFKKLWQRVGLSVDWSQEYSTIDAHSRLIAQLSFLELLEKGHIYSSEAPTMWDIDFQTAVAQAEVEDRPQPGAYHRIQFAVADSDETFVIATTRPELLPACVGVATHPEDSRYQHLIGRTAVTPLFAAPVPIFASEAVDPEKGTGILMVCTFGDANDVAWWRFERLSLRQIIGRNGRLLDVRFGGPGWESLDPDRANARYAGLVGKTLKAGREAVVELLRTTQAADGEPLLRGEPEPITHAVKFFEKGDRPLELITTRQWFVRLLDKKEVLLEKGREIAWYPDFMGLRYANWTENLQLDWCISRQRYFGVSFPVWYRLDAQGQPDYDAPILPRPEDLPVDPMSATPPGYDESQRNQPNGFIGESDVFDTWFTSSMTPQIASRWHQDSERHRRLFPMDLRPQSHEIIRTWAFYTIVKALLHEGTVPWQQAMISGWILDPDRKKMSKSKGNVLTPMHLLDEYGADALRYWAASARAGVDTIFDVKELKTGKRLFTKIFNAGKFVLGQSASGTAIVNELDRAFLAKLKQLAERSTALFEKLDYAGALDETERFFWSNFTDTFLELTKRRARHESDVEGRASAVASLRLGLNVLLRLFAPFLPYITEEVWSWAFAESEGRPSIHRAPWPGAADFADIAAPADPGSFELAVACLSRINKAKTEAGMSLGRPIENIRIHANSATLMRFKAVATDVAASTSTLDYALVEDDGLADGTFEVSEVRFVTELPG